MTYAFCDCFANSQCPSLYVVVLSDSVTYRILRLLAVVVRISDIPCSNCICNKFRLVTRDYGSSDARMFEGLMKRKLAITNLTKKYSCSVTNHIVCTWLAFSWQEEHNQMDKITSKIWPYFIQRWKVDRDFGLKF